MNYLEVEVHVDEGLRNECLGRCRFCRLEYRHFLCRDRFEIWLIETYHVIMEFDQTLYLLKLWNRFWPSHTKTLTRTYSDFETNLYLWSQQTGRHKLKRHSKRLVIHPHSSVMDTKVSLLSGDTLQLLCVFVEEGGKRKQRTGIVRAYLYKRPCSWLKRMRW